MSIEALAHILRSETSEHDKSMRSEQYKVESKVVVAQCQSVWGKQPLAQIGSKRTYLVLVSTGSV